MLGIKKNLSRRRGFVLASPPYNVQTDRKAENKEYDVFDSNDMKDMTKMLGDVIKPKAHRHAFYSTTQFDVRYKALQCDKPKSNITPQKLPVQQ